MNIIQAPTSVRTTLDALRAEGKSIGFVPTMGFLHEGHASLIRAARESCDVVVVSIFVNPLQFGQGEDLDRYPRDDRRDEALCEREGVDLVFRPPVEAMYGSGPRFVIDVGAIGDVMCGRSRPGHFNGVATVVAKLFNIIGPCRAFFGEKDAQQLVILRRLATAFDFPVDVVGLPTIREEDGLAMSSRNAYLSAEERRSALVISRAILAARDLVSSGERDTTRIVAAVMSTIEAEATADIDYVVCVDPETLLDLERIEKEALLAVAVKFPSARLIDNVKLQV